ncbi:MAG: VCBS repeat-containing protein, partial [Bacteroidales bacterium]|nr:VCBS repeat-containing protein [Bacteroidales bacterium]
YDNDGDLDIALTGKESTSNPMSKIYRNDGGGFFTEQSSILIEPVEYSDLDWGDYDADGYLDLIIIGATGVDPKNPITKVYRNNGDNSFSEQTQFTLDGVYNGNVHWIDIDTDGDLDIHITGSYTNERWPGISKIYKYDSGTYTEWSNNLPGLWEAEVDWGDYDHDGDLDVVMTTPGTVYAYENTGSSTFTQKLRDNHGYSSYGDVIWGDYDNDGYLDILFGNFAMAAIIYKNIDGEYFEVFDDGSFKFTSVEEMNWCDYDNDGDIDMLIYPRGGVATLYRNNLIMESGAFAINTSAEAPSGIKSISSPAGLSLHWSPVQTDETPSNSLSYNIRIGTSPDTANITPPHSDSTSFRQISGLGNASVDSSYSIINLETGKYYWQVQAVDMAFKGGQWSAIDSFEMKHLQPFFSFDTVCFESQTQFFDQSVASDPILSWHWDFGDGNVSTEQNPVYVFESSGTHQVTLKVQTSEYADSIIKDVMVRPKPLTDFIADIACQGTSTNITNNTTINGTNVTDWYWDFGDGESSTLQDPLSHGYLNPGDFNVKLVAHADNSCSDSIQNIVTVAEYPVAAITASSPFEFCTGDSVVLSVDYNENYLYTWKIGEASITGGDSSKYTAKISGAYSIEVVNNTGNCTTLSTDANVIVLDAPVPPYISADGAVLFCQGDSVVLSVTENPDYSYQWKLNTGAIGIDTNIYYAKSSGNYILEVSNSAGCVALSSNSVDITVNEIPTIPSINLSGPTSFCAGDSVIISVTNNPAYTYQWKNELGNISGSTT